jgi:hypothetical protein
MLWLLQCLDGEPSSGESPVPQIRSICKFLLSRLFPSLSSSVLRSGFSWVSSVWRKWYFSVLKQRNWRPWKLISWLIWLHQRNFSLRMKTVIYSSRLRKYFITIIYTLKTSVREIRDCQIGDLWQLVFHRCLTALLSRRYCSSYEHRFQ